MTAEVELLRFVFGVVQVVGVIGIVVGLGLWVVSEVR